ncbi:MAG: acyl carrier protein [Nitrospirae bacterium]|nr:acyl carrier protein [Nitrospirota bacterium]
MKSKEIERKIKKILAYKLDISVEKINLTSSLSDDLGLDSFGKVELSFALEEDFGINIIKNAENIPRIITLKDLIDFLKQKLMVTSRK